METIFSPSIYKPLRLPRINCKWGFFLAAIALFSENSALSSSPAGQVVGWGDMIYPVMPRGTVFTQISAGAYHNLALKSDGTVVAWGSNSDGQSAVPPGLSNVVAISAGGSHSLALSGDGTVTGWGYAGAATVPTGLSGVRAIAAGWDYSMVLKTNGIVIGWGNVTIPGDLTNVAAIAAGGYQQVALKKDGTVIAWGSFPYQPPPDLSNVTAISSARGFVAAYSLALRTDGTLVGWGFDNANGAATPPVGLSNVVGVAVGEWHTVALKSDGTAVAWGAGTNNLLDGQGWGQAAVPSGLKDIVSISAGWTHTLALSSNGSLIAWGDNAFGQSVTPSDLSDVQAVAIGEFHNVALKSGGTLISWGYNRNQNPFQPVMIPAGLSNVIGVAAGSDYSLALRRNGTVIGWGDNNNGGRHVPAGLTNVVAIAAHGQQSAALLQDGTVVGWGTVDVPVGLSNVVAIVAGQSPNIFAVKSDGTVFGWDDVSNVVAVAAGGSRMAVLADGTVLSEDWNPGATQPPNLSNVIAVASGTGFQAALKRDGTVVSWGYNVFNMGETNVPAGLSNVVVLQSGQLHSLAIMVDLKIDRLDLTDENAVISFHTFLGQNYTVQGSPDMSPGSWNTLPGGNVAGTGYHTIVTDTNALLTASSQFYRIKLLP